MKHSDKPYFSALMMKKMNPYKKTLHRCTLQEYWQVLQDYTLIEIEHAWKAHLRDPDRGQFPPLPADLIRNISGSYQAQALLAWAKVLRAIRQVGRYDSVAFDDPLIHVVLVIMGGWVQLCANSSYVLLERAKEFQCHYCDFLKHRPTQYPKLLYGVHQSIKPVLIGDQQRARQVMMGQENSAMVIHRKNSVKPPSNL